MASSARNQPGTSSEPRLCNAKASTTHLVRSESLATADNLLVFEVIFCTMAPPPKPVRVVTPLGRSRALISALMELDIFRCAPAAQRIRSSMPDQVHFLQTQCSMHRVHVECMHWEMTAPRRTDVSGRGAAWHGGLQRELHASSGSFHGQAPLVHSVHSRPVGWQDRGACPSLHTRPRLHVDDADVVKGFVRLGVGLALLDGHHHIHALDHPAEHGVLAVQPGRCSGGDEELPMWRVGGGCLDWGQTCKWKGGPAPIGTALPPAGHKASFDCPWQR